MNDSLYDEYLKIFKEKKIKLTNVRQSILKILSTRRHFTVNELISELENEIENVNIMSVYNNIDLLLELHLLFANTINGKQIIYEAISPQLTHLKCHKCGKFDHIASSSLDNELLLHLKRITESIDFDLEHFKLELHGLCSDCKK
ncbi:Fur family transcriptional regulator [Spiroplasma helicoides]|uniref:Fur family transcriptional regulator n=1 Tax=Spiroplasma helicoides TaxID=216938 RepID=A0A1B3SLF9_9MOLU|nr:transcriptional repressor [Spiroplasma helicoides]AOG60764.1 Fur family transcriptional regulator [Spiroplasma helicoides]